MSNSKQDQSGPFLYRIRRGQGASAPPIYVVTFSPDHALDMVIELGYVKKHNRNKELHQPVQIPADAFEHGSLYGSYSNRMDGKAKTLILTAFLVRKVPAVLRPTSSDFLGSGFIVDLYMDQKRIRVFHPDDLYSDIEGATDAYGDAIRARCQSQGVAA